MLTPYFTEFQFKTSLQSTAEAKHFSQYSARNTGLGSNPGRGKDIFSSSQLPDRLWVPPMGTGGSIAGGLLAQGVNLTSYPHIKDKIVWSYTSTPPYVLKTQNLLKNGNDFTVYLHRHYTLEIF
jgi:hypothetical protein